MDLYFNPISPYSHKALMAFYEKDVAFNPIAVDLTDAKVREEYRQVYALGKVPCLKAPASLVPESSNIVEWLDQHYQVGKLIPTKAEDARQVRYWDRIADHYLAANVSLLFFQGLKPQHLQDGERMATAKRQVEYMYREIEGRLATQSSQWLVSDRLTMADLSVAAGLALGEKIVPIEEYPHVQAYLQRWQQRPSFIKARAGVEEAAAAVAAALARTG